MAMRRLWHRFPFVPQHDAMDCGPACLAMISQWYGRKYSLQFLRSLSYLTKDGVSLLGLTTAAEAIGLESYALKFAPHQLQEKEIYPSILYWNASHFVVLINITVSPLTHKMIFHIADPSAGFIRMSEDQFISCWCNTNGLGVVFVATPGKAFYENKEQVKERSRLKFALTYLHPFRGTLFKLSMCLACTS